jgi:predicted hydrocarbon binding protein
MKIRQERLGQVAAVKGTMVQAHLLWASAKVADAQAKIVGLVTPECAEYVNRTFLATDWMPFRCLVGIDRAIATLVGGSAEAVYRELGRHSASQNLAGAYKSYAADEPHRFFANGARLHNRFQNFGKSSYEQLGERQGRVKIEEYAEYSPVFCASGVGYYEGCLRMMKVPGPVFAVETSCQCAGDPACVFDLSW